MDDTVSSTTPDFGSYNKEDLYSEQAEGIAQEIVSDATKQSGLESSSGGSIGEKTDQDKQVPSTSTNGVAPPVEPSEGDKDVAQVKPQTHLASLFKHLQETLPPKARDLIYWKNPRKTAIVFGTIFAVLLMFSLYSIFSVLGYLGLAALGATLSFRIYKLIVGGLQHSPESHPFRQYLDMEVVVPSDHVHHVVDHFLQHITCAVSRLRRLILVENIVDSLKLGLLFYVLTFVGEIFNLTTVVLLVHTLIFTVPKIYDTHQEKIDATLSHAIQHMIEHGKVIHNKLYEALPPKAKEFVDKIHKHKDEGGDTKEIKLE